MTDEVCLKIKMDSLVSGHFFKINLATVKMHRSKKSKKSKEGKNRPFFAFFAPLAFFASSGFPHHRIDFIKVSRH